MPSLNPKMNNTVPETDRTVQDYGFMGMPVTSDTHPPSHYNYSPPLRSDLPTPLVNEVNPSSDSTQIEVGPSAGDITARSRNG